MRPLTCVITAGMFAVVAFSANAATTAYGEAFDTLYRFDLDARQATPIGGAGRHAGQIIGNISGLTTTVDGSLYAIGGGQKLLLRIDPASGDASVVGDIRFTGVANPPRDAALDLNMIAACDGTLWLSSAVLKTLWTIDPATGITTHVGPTGAAITGLASRGNAMYGAGGKGDNTFYRIDPVTGAATAIGSFGPQLTTWVNSVSMSFDREGTLWAVINYVPPEHDSDPAADWSDLATIDPSTGTVTLLGPITGPDALRQVGMKGFTVDAAQCVRGTSAPHAAPIGSPWALGLLGLLLAGASWRSRGLLRG